MNILILSIDFLPNYGGVSSMTHHMANGLSDLGLNVFVMSPFEETGPSAQAKYTYIQDEDAKTEIQSGVKWQSDERPRVVSHLESIIRKNNITTVLCTHVHYYGQALPYLKLDKNLETICGIYLHGQEIRSCFGREKRVQALHERMIQRTHSHRSEIFKAIRESSLLFCNSQFTKSLVNKITNAGKINVVGCGVPDDIAHKYLSKDILGSGTTSQALARDIFNLPQNVNIIGSVGRLVPHKNNQILIQSLKNRPSNIHALICGDGPEKEGLKSLAIELGLSNRVHFRSASSDDEKWKIIESMDQLVLLSECSDHGSMEGFGIVLLEAMLVGVPTICSGSGGMTDIVQDRITGLILPKNTPKALAKVSETLLDDKSMRMAITINAREMVTNQFLWSHVCKRILNVAKRAR